MTYIILAGLCVATVFERIHSKLLSALWIVFGTILAFYSTTIADRISYYNMYYRIGIGSSAERVEFGFRYLIKVANFFHLSADQFYFLIFLLTLCLYSFSFERYVQHSNMVFMMYIIFPFAVDAAQIRTMLADAIVIYALRYLEECKLKNMLAYVFCIILAVSIHNLTLFFILFLCVYIIKDKKKFLLCCALGGGLVYYLCKNNYLVSMLKRLVINLSAASYLGSMAITERAKAYFIWVTLIVGLFLLMYRAIDLRQYILSGEINVSKDVKMRKLRSAQRLWNIAFYANVFLIFTAVFVMFSSNFMRLARVFVLIDYLVFEMFIEGSKPYRFFKLSRGVYIILLFILLGITIWINCNTVMNRTYYSILNDNWLFSYF